MQGKELIQWFLKEKWIIFLLLIALLACTYTIATVGDYQKKCNDYWLQQIEDLKCRCGSGMHTFNGTVELPLIGIELQKD